MHIIRIIIVFLVASILADAAAAQDAREHTQTATEPRPQNAVRSILRAFDKYGIVALGEVHRNQQVHDFILSLARDPSFPGKVNDIVVEFGNARYQDLMDRYISGEAVSPGELRKIWRDTVNILVWDAPVYERFFAAIRALNRGLPEGKRLRVLLGDPPFDWNEIQSKEEWERLVPRRDPHAAKVIEEEVLAKNHKALLIFGAQHLMRSSAYNRFSSKPQELNLAEILDQRHPGATLLIWPHTSGYLISELEPRFASWPKLSLAFVKGTWLGTVHIGEPTNSPKLEQLTDAFLYLGPVRSLKDSRPSPTLYSDDAYFHELVRRDKIQGGFNRLELEELKKSLLRKPWVTKQR
jgi:hypothetical protein